MNIREFVQLTNRLLKKSIKKPTFNRRQLFLTLDENDLEFEYGKFIETNTNIAKIVVKEGENTIRLDLSDKPFNTSFFLNLDDFTNRFEECYNNSEDDSISLAIIDYKQSYLIYREDCNSEEGRLLILNAIAYIEFKQFMKSDKVSDYYDKFHKQVIFYTPEKGIKKISIPYKIPVIEKKNVHKIVEGVIEKLSSNIGFVEHFKNKLFGSGDNLHEIYTNLENIYQESENEFRVWSKKFSIESIVDDIKRQTNQYFKSIRDLLSKITTQVLSTPIAISASIFATAKVNDTSSLILIVIAYTIYLLFVLFFMFIYMIDLCMLKNDYSKELALIIKKSGLSKEELNHNIEAVSFKICITMISIIVFIIFIVTLSALFYFYSYNIWKALVYGIRLTIHNIIFT